MAATFDRQKSLQDLENEDWGEPILPTSYLIGTTHRLRRKPLREFTVEDLRIMIGQNLGLPYLIPIAIERLREDPFVGGDFYPGDLLERVLKVNASFWQEHSDLWTEVAWIVEKIEEIHDTLQETILPAIRVFTGEAKNE